MMNLEQEFVRWEEWKWDRRRIKKKTQCIQSDTGQVQDWAFHKAGDELWEMRQGSVLFRSAIIY